MRLQTPWRATLLVAGLSLAAVGTGSAQSLIELQKARVTQSVDLHASSEVIGSATLIDLQPAVGAWYVLTISFAQAAPLQYHIEDSRPEGARWSIETVETGSRLFLVSGSEHCEIWSNRAEPLQQARESGLPFVPLCNGRLYLRNNVEGTYTRIERVTQFLRDHVWGGDRIVTFVRDEAFRDAYIESGREGSAATAPRASPSAPIDAELRPEEFGRALVPEHLGIEPDAETQALSLGRWYPVRDLPGIYVGLMRGSAVPPAMLESDRSRVNELDAVESAALDYLVAFDLTQFDLHFALGTDHPRLGWSERALPEQRDARLPGPDGFDHAEPLARTGMVSPALTAQVVATFAGGFKREHGAFHYGDLAQTHSGSHYGFMEQGVIFSRLVPGLATVYRDLDGVVDLKTWSVTDAARTERIVDARQNGVPLIEYDPSKGRSRPGALVNQWGAGNWSGSSEMQLRTVRAGLCLQVGPERSYLLFGYFSAATPSTMARVFQSYGCRYAMQLDINALEHTYLALYAHRAGRTDVEHLVDGMAEVDRKGGDQLAPRFLGFPDDRDFFYLTRKAHP